MIENRQTAFSTAGALGYYKDNNIMSSEKENMKKDCWDIVKIISEIIAIVVIAFYGYRINATLKQKELNVKMIELSIDILTIKPSKEADPLREWAIDILDRYSEVPISEEARAF